MLAMEKIKFNRIKYTHVNFKYIYTLHGVHKWLGETYSFFNDNTYIRLHYGCW